MRWKALFWILIGVLCVLLAFRLRQSSLRPHAIGFLLQVGNFDPPENCELKVPLVFHVSANHALRLGNEPMSAEQLARRLDLILKLPAKPVLYIDANSEMTMQQFIQILDFVRKINDGVEVRLITPGNRQYSCIDAPQRTSE
jgi:biopolymer transport protein ExbD